VTALAALRRRHPGIRLVLAGSGTQEQALRAQVRSLRLGRSVQFAGQLTTARLAALLGAADLVLAPSLYEPFGLVALEAAVAGTPLVVSDTGGLAELVEPGVTGIRVRPDDPAALAAGIAAMLADQVGAQRMARNARANAATMSWDQVAQLTAEVYAHAVRDERVLRAAARPTLRMVVPDGNLLADEG
jgi:glycogen(starch) synthase